MLSICVVIKAPLQLWVNDFLSTWIWSCAPPLTPQDVVHFYLPAHLLSGEIQPQGCNGFRERKRFWTWQPCIWCKYDDLFTQKKTFSCSFSITCKRSEGKCFWFLRILQHWVLIYPATLWARVHTSGSPFRLKVFWKLCDCCWNDLCALTALVQGRAHTATDLTSFGLDP